MLTKVDTIPKQFNDDVYKLLTDMDHLLYFRWDLQTDTLEFTEPTTNAPYDIPQYIPSASSALLTDNLIHPDDKEPFWNFLDALFWINKPRKTARRRSVTKMRLRKRRHTRDYLWVDLRLLTYYTKDGPAYAFGCIRNINKQQLWQIKLEHSAEHDILTGFLNKGACERRVARMLRSPDASSAKHAMIIVDADGFKAINDAFGHLFGDGVLKDMSMAIKQTFRRTDILGRIGGDEFLVLFRNLPSMEILKKRCNTLLKTLHRSYQNNNDKLPFSVSIGVAVFPEHGTSYQDLFTRADRALYEAKSQGRNRYCFYHSSLIGNSAISSTRDTANTADIQQKAFKDNMLEFIFTLLYETNNPDATIALCIGLFGKQFQLDRVSIDRFHKDTNQYVNAFEWTSPKGVSLRQENHEEDISALIEGHNKMVSSRYKPTPYGVMAVCQDTSELGENYQELTEKLRTKSFAHCIITHGSEDLGCIGFESSASPRPFSEEEIKDLNIFAVLLGNILMDSATEDILRSSNNHLKTILDHMQEFIYVIDKDTYIPIYFNQTIRQTLSESSADQPCYKRFHGLAAPCTGCPIPRLSRNGNEYLDVTLDNWGEATNTRAYNIYWEDDRERHLALIMQEPF